MHPGVPFSKGHGTQNDFVILPDTAVALDLDAQVVARLCDRQQGIGADGVLRVARAGALVAAGVLPSLPEDVQDDDWFMDYRNADGSIAEMCGNGVRVFAHYLRASGLEERAAFTVGSRAGARPVTVHEAGATLGAVTVDMGIVRQLGESHASVGGREFAGIGIDVGNPHLACIVEGMSAEELGGLDLGDPEFDHEFFPHGVNIEIVTPLDQGAVSMRVNERGVGETRSCGTGTVAAAAAALLQAGQQEGEVSVTIPGGTVAVTVQGGRAWLRGPSVLVGEGMLSGQWWADN
ncbi:diaminopimelate epimerase [Hoyosella sp. G463]|uniref:Diaminopimelate epimerase n=1 Tax=Lolliginicoccus lacisalsi TaxID=2742202 RepID=A0A927PLH2_9ACTN|nr:diaminopimelate epimerase [Lolliginicoccus lacisalsi]MBD8505401.1 diaminopimelate epimerase [Lolliginicoccus lacisalsi]